MDEYYAQLMQYLNTTGGSLAGFKLNPNMEGSSVATAITTPDIGEVSDQTKTGFFSKARDVAKNIGGKTKDGLGQAWNSVKSGGAGYDLLQSGMSIANAQMNKDLVNSNGFNTANRILDGAAQIGGKINPIIGLAVKGVQTGLNAYNNLTTKETEDFSVDQDTQQFMGNSYTGSYQDMSQAESQAGLKFGGFNKKGYNQAAEAINEAQRMDTTLQDINKDNQTRLAMMANTQANGLNYTRKLNGGLDAKYLRAAKLGIKLDSLNRIKNIKVKQKINIDTKQVEEFKQGGVFIPIITDPDFIPIITDPIESFKEGGIIIDEFVPIITDPVEIFKDGGKTEENELVKLEETNQKNVIPEGALHKNKHHIENTEGLTQKGIPVIDNNGEQQAEIELDEIIFTLEVTKKLEELHKIYKEGDNKEKDKAAIEAGKLLVQEILYNTDDRTGLISKCEKGGKL